MIELYNFRIIPYQYTFHRTRNLVYKLYLEVEAYECAIWIIVFCPNIRDDVTTNKRSLKGVAPNFISFDYYLCKVYATTADTLLAFI